MGDDLAWGDDLFRDTGALSRKVDCHEKFRRRKTSRLSPGAPRPPAPGKSTGISYWFPEMYGTVSCITMTIFPVLVGLLVLWGASRRLTFRTSIEFFTRGFPFGKVCRRVRSAAGKVCRRYTGTSFNSVIWTELKVVPGSSCKHLCAYVYEPS